MRVRDCWRLASRLHTHTRTNTRKHARTHLPTLQCPPVCSAYHRCCPQMMTGRGEGERPLPFLQTLARAARGGGHKQIPNPKPPTPKRPRKPQTPTCVMWDISCGARSMRDNAVWAAALTSGWGSARSRCATETRTKCCCCVSVVIMFDDSRQQKLADAMRT